MSLEQRNAELDKKIAKTDLNEAVTTLVKDAKKRRRQLRWLALSIVFDLLLTVGLGYLSVQTHRAASKAEDNHTALIRNCETSNEARANNKQLWDYLLNLPTPNAPTLQQKEVRNQFSVFVGKTFSPRNCSKL